MNWRLLSIIFLSFLFVKCQPDTNRSLATTNPSTDWPDSMLWWKANNLRLIQMNLPAYEAELNVDSLLEDLQNHSANTLLINAGGIMAFYPSKLDFEYINPYMKENMLRDVIEGCHKLGMRVIVRFDFSRAHESIFKEHPDWFYISPQGERMINTDMYVIAINAPYVQEKAMEIVAEVIDNYPIDGIFINMPGYHTANHYAGTYHGIDQNKHDQERFKKFSGGLKLPLKEDDSDPVFQKYKEFQKFTMNDWLKRMRETVKSRNEQIAICTYNAEYVDIIRHESQTRSLPYWPYNSSDNVNSTVNSHPNHIVSNASIQQISFQSRYNAIEPEEIFIRLYENIAHGSGLDISLMGDMRDYEDERNFETVAKIYAHHKKYEPYYGKYISPAEIAIIAPGYWPGGDPMQEGRGVQLMLKEAHIQFDIIESGQIVALKEKVQNYRVLILPDITNLNSEAIKILEEAIASGTHVIATNRTLQNDEAALARIFGAKIIEGNYDGTGNYLRPANKDIFKRFEQQSMLFWKFNLGIYDLSEADDTFLPILAKGRPGPPEKIGGHDPIGRDAMGVKQTGSGKAVILPMNIGKLYYIHGYEQHKNILLDVLEYVFPEVNDLVQTNAHEKVEVILQKYISNTAENIQKQTADGMILHLVNITGFSGNTYFNPLPVSDLKFKVKSDFKPTSIFSMVNEETIDYAWADGYLTFTVDELKDFDGIVINR